MKSLSVRQLSAILATVASELRQRFGLTRLAIGGGSAPALLDHLFSGGALRMRDLDLVLIADRPVEEELARSIGEALHSPEMRFLPRYVYPRRRSREDCTNLWVAGWGLIWDVRGVEVDLSIFHDEKALDLNGLMNVDRIRIPFGTDHSLNEIAAEMLKAGSPEAAIAKGLVEDPANGYFGWTHRSPSIVAWNAILASPLECAIRIVRACAHKLHLSHLRPELADPLQYAIARSPDNGDRFIRVRSLVKLFHDDRVGAELEMLHELGGFLHWLPEIGAVIDRLGHGGLHTIFTQADREGRRDADHHAAFAHAGEQGGDEISALRLEALLLNMPRSKRENVLTEIARAEPTFASLVRNQLPRVERRSRSTVVKSVDGKPAVKRTATKRTTASKRMVMPPPQLMRAMNEPVDFIT
ncbi:MAG TPA: hypothetical protein VFV49_16755 [Thermoanaerobaculia bacterium]|nr:hypothetical protein [Thermoanaerobaculia bacterium]